jgi:hypothetical protein
MCLKLVRTRRDPYNPASGKGGTKLPHLSQVLRTRIAHRNLLCFVVLSLWATPVFAAISQALVPVDDRDGGANGGPTFTLRPAGLDGLIVGNGFSGAPYRAAMEFSLNGTLPVISNASLQIFIDLVSDPPAQYTVHGYFGDGVITVSDLLVNNPILPTQTTPNNSGNYQPVFDVTAFIQQAENAHASHAGFMFSGFSGPPGFAMGSSEDTAMSPRLNITSVVPEPLSTAAASFLTAIALRCGRSSRRRSARSFVGLPLRKTADRSGSSSGAGQLVSERHFRWHSSTLR